MGGVFMQRQNDFIARKKWQLPGTLPGTLPGNQRQFSAKI
jgi:hypothetical protein